MGVGKQASCGKKKPDTNGSGNGVMWLALTAPSNFATLPLHSAHTTSLHFQPPTSNLQPSHSQWGLTILRL